MKPYRRRLVGLPLQRSLFGSIGQAPAAIGIHGVLPGDRFSAWLDEDGDLYLDKSQVDQLSSALPSLATADFLDTMQRRLTAVCEGVAEATHLARQIAPQADEVEARAQITRLGAELAALIPYGILSKFIPDALYEIAKSAGDTEDPPFPAVSPGVELTQSVAVMSAALRARRFSPERLQAEWPDVPSEIAVLVRECCRLLTGHGPLPWDAPGYEDPYYLISVLSQSFESENPEEFLRRLQRAGAETDEPDDPDLRSPVRRVLALWLQFLEYETWYVRYGFFVGLLPLLRRLVPVYRQADPMFVPEDILFLELAEVTTGATPSGIAATRRKKYLADREYYGKYGVTAERLHAIMEPV